MKKLRLFASILSLCVLVSCGDSEETNTENTENTIQNETNNNSESNFDNGQNTENNAENNNTNEESNNNNDNNENTENNEATDVLIKSLTFSKDSVEIAINRGYQIEYDIKPFNATNKSLRWSSTDYVVAAVTKEGRIAALGEGECVISATTMDGSNITASIDVKVTAIKVDELDLDTKSKEMNIGDTYKIQPVIYPSNATYQNCIFTSNDESVATVDVNGKVKAVGNGETDIVVTSERYPDVKILFHVKCNAVIAENINYRLTDLEIKEGENYFFVPSIFPTNTTNKTISYTNSNPEVVSVSESGEIYALTTGEATVQAISNSNTDLVASLKVVVKGKDERVKSTLSYTYKDFAYNNLMNVDNANYKTTHALVIPVWFTDSNTYISNKKAVREDINKAYFGSNSETGWRSVKTFYEEESRGRYTLTGVTTDWFECGLASRTFYSEEYGGSKIESLIKSAVNWYKKSYNVNALKGFDADSNGFVDSVILIYGAPDYSATGNPYASNMWAYTSWLCKESDRSYDNPGVNAYFWASYDFMYGANHPHNLGGYYTGDTRYCNIDTHTYIHEFGHVLGLNDYYDYSNQYSPAGGFSMQDQNVGGHDPYSLLTYGFVDPYIVNNSTTITINDFQSSGDVVLISNNKVNSPFDEYILLELYTPTGLNEFDTKHRYCDKGVQGIDEVGIRIWHVDGRLVYGNSSYNLNENNITTNPLIEGYDVWNMMNNTYYSAATGEDYGSPLGKKYMDYNELQLIRNDTSVTYKDSNNFDSNFLFKEGDTFSINKFGKQFVNKYYLNDKSNFTFEVEIMSIEDNKATINIKK